MIPIDAAGLLQEVENAQKALKNYTRNTTTLVRRYVGNYYDRHRGTPSPENMIFSYLAGVLPSIIFDNPVINITAKRIVTDEPIAKALEMAVNAWIADVRLRDELELVAVDMLFGFGLVKVGLEARGDFPTDPSRGVQERTTMEALVPYAVRVNPTDVLLDPEAGSFAEARFVGQTFARDLEALQGDDRYDQEIVKQLTADDDHRRKGAGRFDARPRDSNRQRVTLHELYLPEHRKIVTMTKYGNGEPALIREVEYRGPDDGPYVMFGVYPVPGMIYPLSPLSAMAEQFMDLNAHATAAAQEAASHKNLVAVDENNPDLGATIQKAPTGSVIRVPGLSKDSIHSLEMGGTSAHRISYLQVLRDRLDRVIGFSDAQRGRASGTTATEAQIVASNDQARDEFVHLKFREGVRRTLAGVAWFCFYDDAVVMPVTIEDEGTGQPVEGVFLGGVQPGQESTDFLDFRLEIEAMSMRRMDPATQRQQAQEMLAHAMTVGQAIPAMPWINWKALLDMLGEASNIPDLASRLLNQQGLAMLQAGVLGGVGPGSLPGQELGPGAAPGGARDFLHAAAGGAPVAAGPPNLLRPNGTALQQNPTIQAAQELGYIRGGPAAA